MSGARRILLGVVLIHLCIGLFAMVGSIVMLGVDDASDGAGLPLFSRALLFAVDQSHAIYLALVLSDGVAVWALCTRRALSRGWAVPAYVAAVLLLAAAHVVAVAIATRIGTFQDASGVAIVLDPSMLAPAAIAGGILGIPAALTGATAMVARRRRRPGACRNCGYELAGLPIGAGARSPALCPECGTAVEGQPGDR